MDSSLSPGWQQVDILSSLHIPSLYNKENYSKRSAYFVRFMWHLHMKTHLKGEHSDPERQQATRMARKSIGKCLFEAQL